MCNWVLCVYVEERREKRGRVVERSAPRDKNF